MKRSITEFEKAERIEAQAVESRRRLTRQLWVRLCKSICDIPTVIQNSFHHRSQGHKGGGLAHA